MEDSIAKARAENNLGLINSITAMLEVTKDQIAKIGCKGTEAPAAAPIAVPSSMSSDDVAASKISQPALVAPSDDVVKSAMALAAKISESGANATPLKTP